MVLNGTVSAVVAQTPLNMDALFEMLVQRKTEERPPVGGNGPTVCLMRCGRSPGPVIVSLLSESSDNKCSRWIVPTYRSANEWQILEVGKLASHVFEVLKQMSHQNNPCRRARATAAVRPDTSSLLKMLLRCRLTVRGLITSVSATMRSV